MQEEGEGEPPVRYQVYTRYRYLGTRTAGINILIFFLFSSPPFLFFSFNLILLKYHIFYLKQEENWLLFIFFIFCTFSVYILFGV